MAFGVPKSIAIESDSPEGTLLISFFVSGRLEIKQREVQTQLTYRILLFLDWNQSPKYW